MDEIIYNAKLQNCFDRYLPEIEVPEASEQSKSEYEETLDSMFDRHISEIII